MKKAFYVALTVILSGVLMSSVFAKAPNKTKITFWDENAGPNRTPYYEELIKGFEGKNPDIQVEYVGLPWSNAKQKYDVAIAANEVPDCGGMPLIFVSSFIMKNALLDLDKYFDHWDQKNKISNLTLTANRSLAKNHKLYMIPNTTTMSVFWYRADIYKSLGLDAPKTWDGFYENIKKTTNNSKNIYGFSLRGGPGSVQQLEDMMFAYSGITAYFTEKGKCTVNDPKNVEAVKRFVAMYKVNTQESDITNGYKEMVAAFDSGRAMMIQHNLGSYGEHLKALRPDQFAACPFPKSISGNRVVKGGQANGYGIFRASKHPDAAWKFISYLCSVEAQSYWNYHIGQLPTNSDVYKEDWVKKYPHIEMAGEVLADKNSATMMPPIYLPEYSAILTQLVEPSFQEVLLGRKTPESFLNEWATAMEKAKANFDKINK